MSKPEDFIIADKPCDINDLIPGDLFFLENTCPLFYLVERAGYCTRRTSVILYVKDLISGNKDELEKDSSLKIFAMSRK